MTEISREEAVRYLLGSATDTEKEALERRFFEDASAAEEVEAFEDELVDDYVAGRLPAAERTRFEQSYLAMPERAEKVEFARALRQSLSGPAERAPSAALRYLPLAAAVLLAVAGGYFAYRFNESRRELSRLEGQQASLEQRQRQLSRELARTQEERARLEKELELARKEAESYASQIAAAQHNVAGTIAFTLAGGLTRDAGRSQKTLEIPAGTKQVKLSMSLPADEHASYSAEIRTPEGREIWKAAGLLARRIGSALSVDLTVPARLLVSGDYVVTVTGLTRSGRTEPTADFSFRARKT